MLSEERCAIRGAYPVTTENTPYVIHVNRQTVHATCALDALSVGPMFGVPLTIESRCRVTDSAIHIELDGERIIAAPPPSVRVGVRWQAPSGSAAHGLCMETALLRDQEAAGRCHGGDLGNPQPVRPRTGSGVRCALFQALALGPRIRRQGKRGAGFF